MLDITKDDLLIVDKINSYLNEFNCNNYNVEIFSELDSTNTYILKNLNILKNNTVIAAEMQTAGRGRFANKWLSQKSVGLTFSVLRFFDINLNVETLPLVIAIAINRLLTQYDIPNKIKWPNDICDIYGNKVAGILLESGILTNSRYIVIGIGVNDSFKIERSLFLTCLLKHIDDLINEFIVSGFTLLSHEWLENCIHYNKTIGVYQNAKFVVSGINTGLSPSGAILVKTADNITLAYSSASLRFEF